MSHPARLSLRAPPHLPFIQGFPGIPPGNKRQAAGVSGTVEVRVGAQAVKAKWVRVEIRRHEQLPPGFPSGSQDPSWEHVGDINTLWASPQGKEFDQLDTADFKFFLPLPETSPPSVEMMKGSGVRYELVAALCYKKKGGLFKSDGAEIIKISEPLVITKHELHSAWPVYNNPDSKATTAGEVTMTINRPGVAFGPGDRILLTAALRSSRAIPFKLRGFECTLMEVVTMYALPSKGKDKAKDRKGSKRAAAGPVVKSRPIAQARCAVDESVGRGGEKSARIDMAVPADNLLVTVRNAKTLEVGYELQIKAVCDGFDGPTVSAIRYVVGPYSRNVAQGLVRDIGHVPSLCPFTPTPPAVAASPPVSRATSDSSGPALRPQSFASPSPNSGLSPGPGSAQAPNGLMPFPQGDWRRQSSSTITTVTADRNHFGGGAVGGQANDWLPLPNGRPYSTIPPRHVSPNPSHAGSGNGNGNGTIPFPTASPAPTDRLYRSTSMTMSDYSTATPDERASVGPMSDTGHGGMGNGAGNVNNRQSSATMATFGAWDKGLQRNLQGVEESHTSHSSPTSVSTRTIPNAFPSPSNPAAAAPSAWHGPNSESEKVRLYDTARQSAAASHRSTGVPLAVVGLDDIPDTAPPEYAPPVPPLPAAVQEERSASRPSSMYAPSVASPSLASAPVLPAIVPTSPISAGPSAFVPASAPGPTGTGSNSAYASGSSSSATATVPRPAPASRPNSTLPTALSEKEQMRRYFEAKDKVERAAGGESSPENSEKDLNRPSGSNSGLGIAAGTGAVAGGAATITALTSAGTASVGDSSAPSYGHSPQIASSTGGAPPIAPTSHAQSSRSGPSSAQTSPALTSTQYPSAEQEKDLMRQRYEEATTRANRARSSLGNTSAEGGAGPSQAATSTGSGFAGSSGFAPAGLAQAGAVSPIHSYPAGIAAYVDNPVGSPSASSRPSTDPAPARDAQIPPSRSSSNTGYMSAEQEKDLMRKRFEDAQARVDKAWNRPRISDTAPVMPPVLEAPQAQHTDVVPSEMAGSEARPTYGETISDTPGTTTPAYTSPPLSPPPPATGSSSYNPAAPGGAGAPMWQSAEAEKEAMRRRFEAASSRVVSGGGARGNGSGGITSGSGGSGSASRPLPPSRPSASASGGTGGDDATGTSARGVHGALSPAPTINSGDRQRPMSMQPPTRAFSNMSMSNGSGQSTGSGNGFASFGAGPGMAGNPSVPGNGYSTDVPPPPPPPLPARPPAEYINLLSPSEAPNKRYSFA